MYQKEGGILKLSSNPPSYLFILLNQGTTLNYCKPLSWFFC
ncbi:hypothetical protein HMPREF3215_02033, partial [Staphylococcus simulans]